MGSRTVFELRFPLVPEPLAEECGDVHIECGGGTEDLRVAGPAETLVTLRAVGRDFKEIVALSPADIAVKLIDFRLPALKGAGCLQFRVQYDCRDFDFIRRTGELKSVHLRIAETVERETGFPCEFLFKGSRGRVIVRGTRTAVIQVVKRTVLIEHFPETDREQAPGISFDSDPDPAGNVLPEVPDADIRPRAEQFHRGDFHDFPYGEAAFLHQRRRVRGTFPRNGIAPCGVIETATVPSRHLKAGVIHFAVVNVRIENRACRRFPAFAAGDRFACAVLVKNFQARKKFRICTVEIAAAPAEVSAVPAVAENRADRIAPAFQTACDIVTHILNLLREIGPAGDEIIVSDPLTIDPCLEKPACGDIEPGFCNLFPTDKIMPEIRAWRGTCRVVAVKMNPSGVPFGVMPERDFKLRDFTCLRLHAVFVPDRHLPADMLTGYKFFSAPFHVQRLIGLHTPGIPQIRISGKQFRFVRRGENPVGGLPETCPARRYLP